MEIEDAPQSEQRIWRRCIGDLHARLSAALAQTLRALSVQRKGNCLTVPAALDPARGRAIRFDLTAMQARHSSHLDVCPPISNIIKCTLR